MISISAPVFDIDGSVVITNPIRTGEKDLRRRVSRIATLDGGAVFNDFGYSEADRTFNIEFRATDKALVDLLARLTKTYARLIVSSEDGCFIGAPESFSSDTDPVRLTILVERKISS